MRVAHKVSDYHLHFTHNYTVAPIKQLSIIINNLKSGTHQCMLTIWGKYNWEKPHYVSYYNYPLIQLHVRAMTLQWLSSKVKQKSQVGVMYYTRVIVQEGSMWAKLHRKFQVTKCSNYDFWTNNLGSWQKDCQENSKPSPRIKHKCLIFEAIWNNLAVVDRGPTGDVESLGDTAKESTTCQKSREP
jgi:hypothetical protein